MEIAAALTALYPDKVELERNRKLIGSKATMDSLAAGTDPRSIVTSWEFSLAEFISRRNKYLIYRE